MAWARHAAGMGLSASEIRAEIMRARDLSKKGSVKRQREYAERTADKALSREGGMGNAFPGLKARAFRQLEADVPARK